MNVPRRQSVVIGLGSEYRSDDAVGVVVARRVARLSPSTIAVGPIGEPLELLNRWEGAELAVIVDATRSGSPPGSLFVLDLGEAGASGKIDAAGGWASTHGLNLAEVHRLAQVLGSAPRRVVVVGVEGERFEDGFGLSASVERALAPATELVLEILGAAL